MDPTWPSRSKSSSRGTSNSRQARPVQGGYQDCTIQCLKALKDGSYHHLCPNADDHSNKSFNLNSVVDDLLECMESNEREVIGGGNSASCEAVRSLKYGHLVVVKAYHEETETVLSDKEVEVYDHLSELQGICIPLILAKVSAVYNGTRRRLLFMSYGGIPLHRCTANDALVDNLAKACTALRTHGIILDDSSPANVLANGDSIAVIDFEMAYIVDPPSPAALESFKGGVEELAERIKFDGWPLTELLP